MVHFKYKGISRNSCVLFKYEGTSQKSQVGIDLKAQKDLKTWINLNTMGILVPQKTHKEGAQTSGTTGGLTQSLRTNGGLAWHLRSNGGLAWPHKTNGGMHGLIEPMVASLLRIPKVQS